MPEKSCFDCTQVRMCSARKAVSESIPFRSNDPNYNTNHSKLFEAIARICEAFEPKEIKKDG